MTVFTNFEIMISSGLSLIVFFSCCFSCSAQITHSIERGEIELVKARSVAALRNPPLLSDVFYATQVLQAVQVTEFSCNCEIIEKLLRQPSSVLEAYYGVASAASCGCNAQTTTAIAAEAISGLKVDLNVIF